MHVEDIKIPGRTTLAAKLYVPADQGTFPGVLLCHGFASCKEEYMALPHSLCREGFAVLSFDFSGHGESTGHRGYVSENSHLDDTLRAYQTLVDRPEVDVSHTALIGHSLGSAAVLRFLGTAAAKLVRCGIVLAPPHQIRQSVSGFELSTYTTLATLAKPMLRLTGKHMYIPYRVRPADLYESSEAIKRATTHKILLPQISVHNHRYLMELQDNVLYAERVQTPMLVIAAEKDKLIPVAQSRKVFEALPNPDNHWFLLEGSGHSMLGDRKAKEVTAEMVAWLRRHMAEVPPEPVTDQVTA
ncbi:MAG: hypothetical protein CVV27_15640 [Candidatus Melainabacteria bacterium HGW-Melainabacteria-1]|nr:MAG: hypothetical protein CVV27_15640 [Candidatus Melainabacteria bacterium HGW-Melainabacteria-1]